MSADGESYEARPFLKIRRLTRQRSCCCQDWGSRRPTDQRGSLVQARFLLGR
jgi:hypothetical protein